MPTLLKFAAVAGVVAVLAGCAPFVQPAAAPGPAPAPVFAEPGFTKF